MKRNQIRFIGYCMTIGIIVALTLIMAACSSKTTTVTTTLTETVTATVTTTLTKTVTPTLTTTPTTTTPTTLTTTPTTTRTLSSIAVTPTSGNLVISSTRQFTATGTYSDGSNANISSLVTWASSNTTVATISSAGLATGVAVGNTNITAAMSGVTSPAVSLPVVTP